MTDKKTNNANVMAALKTINDRFVTFAQWLITVLVMVLILFTLIIQFGFDINGVPAAKGALECVWWALVVALLTGRISIGK